MKNTRSFVSILSLCVIIVAVAASAADLSAKDKLFVTKAIQAGLAEVSAGKLAAQKSSSADVKEFASQMVADHGKAGDELKGIAVGKGLSVPTEPNPAQKALAGKLSAASGAAFDKMYAAEAGVNDHKGAVALFTDEATNGTDPDLKAFAAKTLPTIQHHYEMSQSLAKSHAQR